MSNDSPTASPSAEQVLQQGLAHHQAGRLADAERHYRAILRAQPGHAQAHHHLGLLAVQTGHAEGALPHLRAALEADPGQASYWLAYLDALVRADQHELARQTLARGREQGLAGAPVDALERVLAGQEPAAHERAAIEALVRGGRAAGALAPAQAMTQRFPDYGPGWKLLAAVQTRLGRMEDALHARRTAATLLPDDPAAQHDYGNALSKAGQPAQAEQAYRRALAIHEAIPETHAALGHVLGAQGRLDDAIASLQRSLALKPGVAKALNLLGNTQSFRGDFAAAGAAWRQAWEAEPQGIGLRGAVKLGVLAYLADDADGCREWLAASQPIMALPADVSRNERTYRVYLEQLAARRGPGPWTAPAAALPLTVIGESHSLSAHGVAVRWRGGDYVCKADWIAGCKQWHLASPGDNQYKRRVERTMAGLPRGAAVLMVIGEIDCRPDEGIMRVLARHPGRSMDQVVQATVAGYVEFVGALAVRHDLRLVVSGVPATAVPLDAVRQEDAVRFLRLISLFNAVLMQHCHARGWDFLDVLALSDRGDGVSNGQWHIDQFHLAPAAVGLAFERYCVPPAYSP